MLSCLSIVILQLHTKKRETLKNVGGNHYHKVSKKARDPLDSGRIVERELLCCSKRLGGRNPAVRNSRRDGGMRCFVMRVERTVSAVFTGEDVRQKWSVAGVYPLNK